ncbi:MAG: DUF5107 domain-containing protein [Caldilineaceae bacterium]|nr:DUF5107 domain-containing protein [Caldilineaceae bacterium]
MVSAIAPPVPMTAPPPTSLVVAEPAAMATPVPTTTDVASAPAPAPISTVVYYEEEVTLLTYPYEEYQSEMVDPHYNWPYKRFDMERFRAEAPTPETRTYRLLVLENAYLKILILPEIGGRIWQVIHKATNAPLFYQNEVVKPTHWGMNNQLGWLALGGMEWSVPVSEHGYDWGVPWDYLLLQQHADRVAVTVFTPRDGRYLAAGITITLRAGMAAFEIEPTLTNLADHPLSFSYWHTAMLAPGSGKHPSPDLRFLLPTDSVTVHSTGDATLPAPGAQFSWPIYQGRDFSRLGTYSQYLGFFEAPQAHGPFVALYDPKYDMGVVRIFPPEIATGSKVFSLGWQDALESSNFTDDDSSYVELHSGLAPTFDDQYTLPAGGMVTWREVWYPVTTIGTVSAANELLALAVAERHDAEARAVTLDVYGVRPIDGTIVVQDERERELARLPFAARPDQPFHGSQTLDEEKSTRYTIRIEDRAGRLLLQHTP